MESPADELDIKPTEIKALLKYVNRIQQYEEIFAYQLDTMVRMVWGLLLMIAGILDWYFFSIGVYVSIVPWGLAIFSGLVIHYFSEKYLSFTKEPIVQKQDASVLTVFFILLMLLNLVLNAFELYYFLYPSIAFATALLVIYTDLNDPKNCANLMDRDYSNFIILGALLAGVIDVILGIGLGLEALNYQGIVFGLLFGGSMALVAYLNNKKINEHIQYN